MTLLMLVFGYSGNWQLLLLMLMMVEDLWQRPRWMQPLPISHRARLWMILIPGVFVPMLVTVLGMQIHVPGYDYMQSLHRGAIDTYKQEPRYFDSPSSVSLEYWEKADGPLPRITAPWGETAEPYVVRVFNRVYYNPFTSREANSDRFDNWQFERATTVVFGRPLQLKDFKDGQVNPRRVTQGPRMIVLNIAAALMFAFAVLIGTGLTKWNPAWRYPKLVGAGSIVTVLVPMGSILVAMLMYGFQQGATNVVPQLLERQLMYLATVLPSNILLVVCIVAVPVLALYAVLEWQFRNSEVVGAMPTI